MNGVQTEESKSSLSSPDYDPLIHLNEVFPDPASLSSLPAIQLLVTRHLQRLDQEIELATREQREQQSATREQINELQLELDELFKNVEAVKGKAEKADGVMGNLTGGIRRLDGGKKNLTISMTALKRLQMLSTFIHLTRTNMSNCVRTTSGLQQIPSIQGNCSAPPSSPPQNAITILTKGCLTTHVTFQIIPLSRPNSPPLTLYLHPKTIPRTTINPRIPSQLPATAAPTSLHASRVVLRP